MQGEPCLQLFDELSSLRLSSETNRAIASDIQRTHQRIGELDQVIQKLSFTTEETARGSLQV